MRVEVGDWSCEVMAKPMGPLGMREGPGATGVGHLGINGKGTNHCV